MDGVCTPKPNQEIVLLPFTLVCRYNHKSQGDRPYVTASKKVDFGSPILPVLSLTSFG